MWGIIAGIGIVAAFLLLTFILVIVIVKGEDRSYRKNGIRAYAKIISFNTRRFEGSKTGESFNEEAYIVVEFYDTQTAKTVRMDITCDYKLHERLNAGATVPICYKPRVKNGVYAYTGVLDNSDKVIRGNTTGRLAIALAVFFGIIAAAFVLVTVLTGGKIWK